MGDLSALEGSFDIFLKVGNTTLVLFNLFVEVNFRQRVLKFPSSSLEFLG